MSQSCAKPTKHVTGLLKSCQTHSLYPLCNAARIVWLCPNVSRIPEGIPPIGKHMYTIRARPLTMSHCNCEYVETTSSGMCGWRNGSHPSGRVQVETVSHCFRHRQSDTTPPHRRRQVCAPRNVTVCDRHPIRSIDRQFGMPYVTGHSTG